jgi:two-component system, LytTR family, sensor kinase
MKKKVPIFTFLWIAYLLFNFIDTYRYAKEYFHVIPLLLTYVVITILVFGLSKFILPRFYQTKRYLYFSLSIILCWLLYFLASYLIEIVFEVKYYNMVLPNLNMGNYTLSTVKYFTFYTIISCAYYFSKVINNTESELLKMELAFLRAQINPHFFFNTLEGVILRLRKVDFETGELIATMGHVMRYSVEMPEPDGKLRLSKEVEQIENLIYLYHIRFPDDCHMIFEHPKIPDNLRIIPLMLVTLAENAFRHGEFTEPNKPITMVLSLKGNEMVFTTHNWKRNWSIDPGESVGRENILRRLQLLYPGKHSFTCKEDEHTYSTRLTLKL